MRELKTLKDIEFFDSSFKDKKEGEEYIRNIIRQEAIKWIKHLRSMNKYEVTIKNSAKIEFIIEFFNIKESDLK